MSELLKINVNDHTERKNILTSQNDLQLVLKYESETGLFYWIGSKNNRVKNGSVAGSKDSSGHIQIKIFGRTYLAHRLAWLYSHGEWPEQQIDHINGIKSDNRITNLRDVSPRINAENRRLACKTSKSGILGVSWHKASNSWTSSIKTLGKRKHLGCFKTPELAHEAYLNAKRQLHHGCSI